MPAPAYLALLHYPTTNRRGERVTTSVTNLDIHDISRTARTYGLLGYYLVTPVEEQHRVVGRILEHWQSDQAREYHPDRYEALSRVHLVKTFEDVVQAVQERHGEAPEVVLTDARPLPGQIGYGAYRAELEAPGRTRPVLVVFGTGWGIAPEFLDKVDRILDPIWGQGGAQGYNHLSVRAAAAVILDRLFSELR